jgi:hypothetical protein
MKLELAEIFSCLIQLLIDDSRFEFEAECAKTSDSSKEFHPALM